MAIMAWEVSELQIPTVLLPQNGFQVRQRRFKLRARTTDVQADKSAPCLLCTADVYKRQALGHEGAIAVPRELSARMGVVGAAEIGL